MKLTVIIPAYNEEKTIKSMLRSLPSGIKGISDIDIIVVNDGSTDRTSEIAKSLKRVIVIDLPMNMGVGVATRAGFEYAKKNESNVIITLDADGQHNPNDIYKIIKPIIHKRVDVTIGSRAFKKQMPKSRILGNHVLSIATYLMYGRYVKDSQSGMKAMSGAALDKMEFGSVGFEICSEIVGECKRLNLMIEEVPIQTIYSEYSKKKGQNWLNGINILTKLLLLKIKA